MCSNDCVSCELVGNRATYGGGCQYGSTTNCLIASNISTSHGGGTHFGTHTYDVISNNLAKAQGGGSASSPDVREVLEQLKSEMVQAADALEFERAAYLRDQIRELEGFLSSDGNVAGKKSSPRRHRSRHTA